MIALPILWPLLCAALLLVLPDGRAQRWVSVAACSVQLAITIVLLGLADQDQPVVELAGNWPAPYGIALVLDRLSALLLLLTAFLGLIVALAAGSGLDRRGRHFHALLQFQLMGLSGAWLTADLFNLFVWFELLLIASYALLLHGAGGAQVRAGLRYVVYNLIGSALFLIALALIYASAGTLNLADLARVLPDLPSAAANLTRVGLALLLLVYAIKAALLPLSFWLPGSYGAAPTLVAALFALMTKVGVYALLRVLTALQGADPGLAGLAALLYTAGLVSLLVASLGALTAASLRGLAAHWILASAGLLVASAASGQSAAYAAALYYLLQTTLVAAAAYALVDALARARGGAGDRLDQRGPLRASRTLVLALALLLMAGAGLPPLPGFLAKVLLLQAIGDPWLWAAIVLSSALMLIASARAYSQWLWNHAPAPAAPPVSAGWPALLLLTALGAVSLGATPVHRYLAAAAAQLGAAPSLQSAVLDHPTLPRPEIR